MLAKVGRLTLLVAAIIVLSLPLQQAEARTLYVDAASAGGNGSAGAPFQAISQAAKVAKPGDIVIVRKGVYPGQVRIDKSGRPEAPIVFQGEPGATIDGSGARKATMLVEIIGSNIVFEGFRVQNAVRTGIGLWGTFGVTVRGNVVAGSNGAGIWAGHSRKGKSGRNLIEGNVVQNNCLMNQARNRKSGWPAGISIENSDHSIVRNNRVYENYGEGIGALSSLGVEVQGNIVYDNFSVNVYLDNAPQAEVRKNLIGSTGNKKFFRHGRAPSGVLIANEVTRHPMPSKGIKVVGNTMIGVEDVRYDSYGRNSGLIDSELQPNRVDKSRRLDPGSVSASGT
jgi:parallel beta-helix repeat protein